MTEAQPAQVEIELEDRERVMKFARYTALSMDRMCATILELTKRLEDAHLIPADRKSKRIRDNQMKRHQKALMPNKEVVDDVIEQLKRTDHPNPEEIAATLFRDLDVAKLKRAAKPPQKEDGEE